MNLLNNQYAFLCYVSEDGEHCAHPFNTNEEALNKKIYIDSNIKMDFQYEADLFEIGESLTHFPANGEDGLYLFVYGYEAINGNINYSFVDIDPSGNGGYTMEEFFNEFIDDSQFERIHESFGYYLFKLK